MRSALALSALLLLLPPQPSLSQAPDPQPVARTNTAESDSLPAVNNDNKVVASTGSPNRSSTSATSPLGSNDSSAVLSTSVMSINITVVSSSTTRNPSKDSTPATTGSPKTPQASGDTTTPPSTILSQPQTTTSQKESNSVGPGTQSDHGTTTAVTVKGTCEVTLQPKSSINTVLASAPSTDSASPALMTSDLLTSKAPGNLSQEPGRMTTASGSVGTGPAPSSISQGISPTPPPLVTSSDNPQTSSTMPTGPGTSSYITGKPTTQHPYPIGPSLGPVATPSQEPTGSATQLSSTAPPDFSPSPTSASGDHRIKCEPPERMNEKVLVLNLTNTGLCQAGNPPDDKLVTLLCRAAKATFNPAQDQCHIRLAPIAGNQALAIKEITIETKLLPQDVYELLKHKWDDLKEVGVTDMQLGDQGPPEETEDRFSMPLIITIVCMASFLLLVAALYGCCHQRLSQRKDQQRLTEELQTVENGYHDNPTLEVMETSSEMQEKKVVNLNGELGDSWIVPLDNLIKDDLDEEEDTHL